MKTGKEIPESSRLEFLEKLHEKEYEEEYEKSKQNAAAKIKLNKNELQVSILEKEKICWLCLIICSVINIENSRTCFCMMCCQIFHLPAEVDGQVQFQAILVATVS